VGLFVTKSLMGGKYLVHISNIDWVYIIKLSHLHTVQQHCQFAFADYRMVHFFSFCYHLPWRGLHLLIRNYFWVYEPSLYYQSLNKFFQHPNLDCWHFICHWFSLLIRRNRKATYAWPDCHATCRNNLYLVKLKFLC
jgi:hypothetical protein